jgi:superfamily II DNA or RNA helicase
MGLRDLKFKAVYHPGMPGENIIGDMLIPALSQASTYQRVAGYFSSTSLAVAAQGIAGMVSTGGKYQLVTSHELVKTDLTNLKDAYNSQELEESLIQSFLDSWRELASLEEAIKKKHVEAMLWLLKEGRLEVRVVVPYRNDELALDKALVDKFHPKFGIITDQTGDSIAFSGSANESMNAWFRNLENVMVYKSWLPGQDEYVQPLTKTFDDYWTGSNIPGWRTIALPDAVKNRLVNDFAPDQFPAITLEESVFSLSLDLEEEETPGQPTELWPHQLERVEEWVSSGMNGFLEMATGTGKTKTAVKCIELAANKGTLLTVIGVPYRHIGDQWAKELAQFHPVAIDGSNDWRRELMRLTSLAKKDQLDAAVFIGVKDTLASNDCQKLLNDLSEHFDNYMLVADEAHWFGAATYRNALAMKANIRLGLSATPSRYFDEEGTEVLERYFEHKMKPFSLADALTTLRPGSTESILCPYEYKPVVLELDEEEQAKYDKYTRAIAAQMASSDPEDRARVADTRIARSRVTKKAKSKIPAFSDLVKELGPELNHCLVYCEDNEQLDEAAEVLAKAGIRINKITGAESANPSDRWAGLSQRSHYIQSFERGDLGVLLSMDCLDEGVDIKPARIGILLASSGNSKEFIQRRGRLMRRAKGKTLSTIYDFVIAQPSTEEPNLMASESRRVDEFAADAVNRIEIQDKFKDKKVV